MSAIRIHPLDAYLKLSNMKTIRLIKEGKCEALERNQFIIDGQLYEQTTEVPPTKEALEIQL